MKKIYFTSLLALFTCTLFAQSVIVNNNKTYIAKYVTSPPVIDGMINENAWINATLGGYNTVTGIFPESVTNKINLYDGGTLSGPPPANLAPDYLYNNTCTFALVWDNDWLYFATEVKDSAVAANPTVEYATAGIELYFNNGNGRSGVNDPINDSYPRKYNNLRDMQVQLWHVPAGNAVEYLVMGTILGLTNFGIHLPPSQYVFAVKRTAKGYIYEGKIAWDMLNKEFIDSNTGMYSNTSWVPQNGRTLGFDLGNAITRPDSGPNAELMWNECCFNVNWTRSEFYGNLILSDPINQATIKRYNYVSGTIFDDLNNDCVFQDNELGINGILVTTSIAGSTYYAVTDESGFYQLMIDAENVNVGISTIISGDQYYTTSACSQPIISLGSFSNLYSGTNFPLKPSHCPKKDYDKNQCSTYDTTSNVILVSDILTNDGIRPCSTRPEVIFVTNYGTDSAHNVIVSVTFPGLVTPISADAPYTVVSDHVWHFSIPTLAAGAWKRIIIMGSLGCLDGTYLGKTICTNIELISNYKPIIQSWDKSNLEIFNSCSADSITFTLKNTGSGDMSDSTAVYLFSNDQLVYRGKVHLKAKEWLTYHLPLVNNILLRAFQTKYNPTDLSVETLIDGCSNIYETISYKNISHNTSCYLITDAMDPNGKSASINGLPGKTKISPDQKIDYAIHFQNTGNDTAFNVVVVDTLDNNLDMRSLSNIMSDHSYQLSISTAANGKKVLIWRFNNILLPDSATDPVKSTGQIFYSIYPVSGIYYGTILSNTAGIYFDYNSPVFTNQTQLTIMDTLHIYTTLYKSIRVEQSSQLLNIVPEIKTDIKVYPNPFQSELSVQITGLIPSESFEIYTVQGQRIYQSTVTNERFTVNLQNLPNGIYVWKYGTTRGKLSKE